ncbi:Transformer-2 protein-like protein beta [Aphelenchoides besseyi]|nr:Transformer-2 protein-like protein beta [Aphelenchoides besseyi]KAI6210590.1 Transformer-2 protein-like protein beta [Aphelenchoides besseyi]
MRNRRSRSRSRSTDNHQRDSTRPSRSPRIRSSDNPKPKPCHVLGIFGMSLRTTEKDLRLTFGKYAPVDRVQIIYSKYHPFESRGFAFIYFFSIADATRALDKMSGKTIDGCSVRIDYSLTTDGHSFRPQHSKYLSERRDRYRRSPVYNSRSPGRRRSKSRSRSSSPRHSRSSRTHRHY